jgi:hypothetical protein
MQSQPGSSKTKKKGWYMREIESRQQPCGGNKEWKGIKEKHYEGGEREKVLALPFSWRRLRNVEDLEIAAH